MGSKREGKNLAIENMNDVRGVLVNQIQKLDNKESTPAVANAIFNGIGKILSTVKLEVEYSRYVKKFEGSLPLQIEQ